MNAVCWFAVVLVVFIIITRIIRWSDRRCDMQRLTAVMWVVEWEKQKRDQELREKDGKSVNNLRKVTL